jgi:hypothetical protein
MIRESLLTLAQSTSPDLALQASSVNWTATDLRCDSSLTSKSQSGVLG